MATEKKPTTKKPVAKKPVAKKTTAKKTVAAKTTVKKATVSKKVTPVKAKRSAKQESFKVCKEPSTFMSFKITEQTVYWSILLIYIMLLVLWISNIQLETMRIIDSIRIS